MHGLEPLRLLQGALQFDLAQFVVSALRQLDGHQSPLSLVLLGPDHEMRHVLLERVDDDIRQLAVRPVGAADAIADLEAHLKSPLNAVGSGGVYGRVSSPSLPVLRPTMTTSLRLRSSFGQVHARADIGESRRAAGTEAQAPGRTGTTRTGARWPARQGEGSRPRC